MVLTHLPTPRGADACVGAGVCIDPSIPISVQRDSDRLLQITVHWLVPQPAPRAMSEPYMDGHIRRQIDDGGRGSGRDGDGLRDEIEPDRPAQIETGLSAWL